MSLISRYLPHDDIFIGLDVPDKDWVLEKAASLVQHRHGVDRTTVFRALWRREQTASTGLGHGIAIPHARIAGIETPILLLLRTRNPIVFGAPDAKPVSVLLVILVPEQANDEHLQILADAAKLFSDPAFRQRLEAASDRSAVWRLFAES